MSTENSRNETKYDDLRFSVPAGYEKYETSCQPDEADGSQQGLTAYNQPGAAYNYPDAANDFGGTAYNRLETAYNQPGTAYNHADTGYNRGAAANMSYRQPGAGSYPQQQYGQPGYGGQNAGYAGQQSGYGYDPNGYGKQIPVAGVNGVARVYDKNIFTWVFCFLLGGFGVDRFIRGQVVLGILKIVTMSGFGVWSLVDWIIALIKAYGQSYGTDNYFTFDEAGNYMK